MLLHTKVYFCCHYLFNPFIFVYLLLTIVSFFSNWHVCMCILEIALLFGIQYGCYYFLVIVWVCILLTSGSFRVVLQNKIYFFKSY